MKPLAWVTGAGVFVAFAAIVGIALAGLLNDARVFGAFLLVIGICMLVVGVCVVICFCMRMVERHRAKRRRDRQCR